MNEIKRIIVPLDGSDLAEQVLPHVREIAGRTGAEVLLMTCVVPLATWDPAVAGVKWDREEEAAGEYLERKRKELSGAGLKARAQTMWGDAAECIIKLAADAGAGLVAMTTRGRSGLARLALGSVATKVLHESDVPLLLVRAGEGEYRRLERILLPVDGSPLSQAAVPFVAGLAPVLGAAVVVHHVITPIALLYPAAQMAPIDERVTSEIQQAAHQMTERAAEEIRAAGGDANALVTTGFPADEIVKTAEDQRVGLIVMSTHGRSGLGRWIMGSVADAVVHRTKLPCLLVRPQEVMGLGRGEAAEEARETAGKAT